MRLGPYLLCVFQLTPHEMPDGVRHSKLSIIEQNPDFFLTRVSCMSLSPSTLFWHSGASYCLALRNDPTQSWLILDRARADATAKARDSSSAHSAKAVTIPKNSTNRHWPTLFFCGVRLWMIPGILIGTRGACCNGTGEECATGRNCNCVIGMRHRPQRWIPYCRLPHFSIPHL